MVDWNPFAPDVLGPELAPRAASTLPVYSVLGPASAASMRVDSTVNEAIDQVGIFVKPAAAAGVVLSEVLTAGSEVPTVTTTVVRPDELSGGAGFVDQAGGATSPDLLAVVSLVTLDLTKYIHGAVPGNNSIGMLFPTTGLFTGRRIVDVRIHAIAAATAGSASWQGTLAGPIDPMARNNGVVRTIASPTPVEIAASWGEVNAIDSAQQPWTADDLERFDNTGSGATAIFNVISFDSGVSFRIYQIWLEVDHCAENRVVRDIVNPGVTDARWYYYTPTQPDGATAGFAKVAAVDLTLLLRTPRYGDVTPTGAATDIQFQAPYLESLIPTPPGVEEYESIALNADGTVFDLGDPSGDRLIGFRMVDTGVESVDSQIFVAVDPVVITGTVEQEYTGASFQIYDGLIVSARYTAEGGSVGDLTVQLWQRAGPVLKATAVITKADADLFDPDAVAGWRRIQALFDTPPTLIALNQYYLSFTAPGLGTWEVASLSGVAAVGSPATGEGSYNGVADIATYRGADVPAADLAALVYANPDPPTGLTATPGFTPLDEPEGGCGPTGMPFVTVDWNPTAVPHFAAYELQRMDPFTGWQTIALITDESVTAMVDYHGRLGRLSTYRVRAVAETGSTSPWSTEASAVRASMGCGYTFTNNAAPEMGVAYSDVYTGTIIDRGFDFPESDEVVEQPIYGRDDFVAFIPAERRGPRFQRRLLTGATDAPAVPGEGFADAIRDLSRATLPYVCVCDEDGGRWFANVRVTSGIDRRPGRLTYVEVVVSQVTTVESPIDVAP